MLEYIIVYAHSDKLGSSHLIPMIHKNRPEHLKGMINLPGGKVEKGETCKEAAVRELKEETGLEAVGKAEVVGEIMCNHCFITVVAVQVEYKELVPRKGETEQVQWYHPGKLSMPNLMPNLRLIIPLIIGNVKNWLINDTKGDWKNSTFYDVELCLSGKDNMGVRFIEEPLTIKLKGCGYFK
jgi:8-oxo-dGTP pyrophosphatase MutT (NUDIX family)